MSFAAEERRLLRVYRLRDNGVHGTGANQQSDTLLRADQVFLAQTFEREILLLLSEERRCDLSRMRILEVGSGKGYWLANLIKYGAVPENVFGVDLSPDRIAYARKRLPAEVTLICRNGAALGFADASFDLVFQVLVFTSILEDDLKREVAAEICRVVKPDGLIVWCDFRVNNPRNPDVRGIRRSEIRQLFTNCDIVFKRVLLAPPIARLVIPHSRLAGELLERLPFLRTHYLAAIRPKGSLPPSA